MPSSCSTPSFFSSGFYYSISQRQTRFSRGVVKDALSSVCLPALTGLRMAADGLLSTPLFGLKEPQMLVPPPLRASGREKKGTRAGNTPEHEPQGGIPTGSCQHPTSERRHNTCVRPAAEAGRAQVLKSGAGSKARCFHQQERKGRRGDEG